MNALVDAMRADLEADRRGSPLPPLQRDAPMLSSGSNSALGQLSPVITMPIQIDEGLGSADFTSKTTKEEFLAQCEENEKPYFVDVLAYCESRPDQIIIDWGTKGFSIKDKNKRQILWMFPQAGANSKSNINARTQKWIDTEITQVRVILDATKKIPKWNWRPADLPVEQLKNIINLVCGI